MTAFDYDVTAFDYDVFVIGAGSGGVRASRMAAQQGIKVGIAEDRHLGGTCVNVGCVPKKLFAYAAHCHSDFNVSESFGWDLPSPQFQWERLRDNTLNEVSRLQGIYGNLLNNAGVTIYEGRARVVDAHHVEVHGQTLSCEKILIAVGGWPNMPDIPGKEHCISSNEVFSLAEFPKRLLVIGGGYIAVEFAGIFQALGSQVQLAYRGDLFLRGFDGEIRQYLAKAMKEQGTQLRFNHNPSRIEAIENGYRVTFENGAITEVDCVLAATGRNPKTNDLGLENTNIALTPKGAIPVDEYFQSQEPSIYALGDVIDRMALTPVALAEAMIWLDHCFDDKNGGKGTQKKQPIDYSLIPTAVFSHPNIGTIGVTEEQAREQYPNLDIYRSDFRPMKYSLAKSAERMFIKLLVDADTQQIVGCHILGDDAGEIMQGVAIAIQAGATKADFDRTIGIHPTAAEELVTLRNVSERVRSK